MLARLVFCSSVAYICLPLLKRGVKYLSAVGWRDLKGWEMKQQSGPDLSGKREVMHSGSPYDIFAIFKSLCSIIAICLELQHGVLDVVLHLHSCKILRFAVPPHQTMSIIWRAEKSVGCLTLVHSSCSICEELALKKIQILGKLKHCCLEKYWDITLY